METYLVTGCAAWFELFSIMPLTVELVVVYAVSQVYQELVAGGADEAAGVPVGLVADLGRHHGHLLAVYGPLALGALLLGQTGTFNSWSPKSRLDFRFICSKYRLFIRIRPSIDYFRPTLLPFCYPALLGVYFYNTEKGGKDI